MANIRRFIQKNTLRLVLVSLALLIFVALNNRVTSKLTTVDNAFSEYLNRKFPPELDTNLVIIDIDEKFKKYFTQNFDNAESINNLPNRRFLGTLINAINAFKPKVILLDILFQQSSNSLNNGPLIEVSKDKNIVHTLNFDRIDNKPPFTIDQRIAKYGIKELNVSRDRSYNGSMPQLPFDSLLGVIKYLGHANLSRENGKIRRMCLAINYNGSMIVSLGTLGLYLYFDKKLFRKSDALVFEAQNGKFYELPFCDKYLSMINFSTIEFIRQSSRSYLSLSYLFSQGQPANGSVTDSSGLYQLLQNTKINLTGKIVIIGSTYDPETTTTRNELKPTPVSDNYPGLYVHASFINTVISEKLLQSSLSGGFFLGLMVILFLFGLDYRIDQPGILKSGLLSLIFIPLIFIVVIIAYLNGKIIGIMTPVFGLLCGGLAVIGRYLIDYLPDLMMLGKKRTKILFLAANPKDNITLQIDREIREVEIAIEAAKFSNYFEIKKHGALRISDIQTYLLRYKPDIVHFSGHGSQSNELYFEDNDGKSRPVSSKAIGYLFGNLKGNIRCVVLNACYSEKQAQDIAKYLDCVIGMSTRVGESAAIHFSTAFYRALAFGEDLLTAFEAGRNEIDLAGLNEKDTPRIITMNVDPASIKFIDLENS